MPFRSVKYNLTYLLAAFVTIWVSYFTLEWCHKPILCKLTIVSYTKYCRTSQDRRYADFLGLTRLQILAAKEFAGAISGAQLSKDILQVERAAVELIPHVRTSELLNKDKMADALQSFVANLRGVARGMWVFSSDVTGTVNDIAVLNEWALHTIKETKDPLSITLLKVFGWQGNNQEVLSTTYTRAFEFFSSRLEELISAADELIPQLDDLYMQLIPFDTDISFAKKKEQADFKYESNRGIFINLYRFFGLGFVQDNMPQIRENLAQCIQMKEYVLQARNRIDNAREGLLRIRGDLKQIHKRTYMLSLENAIPSLELQLDALQKAIENLRKP